MLHLLMLPPIHLQADTYIQKHQKKSASKRSTIPCASIVMGIPLSDAVPWLLTKNRTPCCCNTLAIASSALERKYMPLQQMGGVLWCVRLLSSCRFFVPTASAVALATRSRVSRKESSKNNRHQCCEPRPSRWSALSREAKAVLGLILDTFQFERGLRANC